MNKETLADFIAYCEANPSMRFWQALRNWSEFNFILACDVKDADKIGVMAKDTFYWNSRTGR